MNSVKWTMFNLHFWCMSLDWSVTILTVPFLLFPALAGYPLGILSDFGVPTDIQVYLIVTLIITVSASIVTIFENRYFQMFARDRQWRHFRKPILTLNYIFAFTFFIPALLTVPDQGPALEHVFKVSNANVLC
uniref:Serpentine receptor class gamma n=1 Tax=Caenorhabditis tropicalis TaxID=1561998 RepID=A0A1I7V2J9_9PELO